MGLGFSEYGNCIFIINKGIIMIILSSHKDLINEPSGNIKLKIPLAYNKVKLLIFLYIEKSLSQNSV